MGKSKLWYFRLPNSFHALGPVRFDEPVNEREMRKYLRGWLDGFDYTNEPKCKRLPYGTEVWPTSEKELSAMERHMHNSNFCY